MLTAELGWSSSCFLQEDAQTVPYDIMLAGHLSQDSKFKAIDKLTYSPQNAEGWRTKYRTQPVIAFWDSFFFNFETKLLSINF